ncbi:Uncharacterised protein [uncultured archaeon]|nr:Uncharacterised protein [uncultured archaeon]
MRKEVIFILLLVVAVVALLSLSSRFNRGSEADARKFFTEDLANSYPDADVREILTSAQVGEGASAYFLLKARVSYNLSTPCPSRWEVEYYYPPQSFVRRTPTRLVSGCQVCSGSPNCVLSYMEEAVIASHTYAGSEQVGNYLTGHPAAKPTAKLLSVWNNQLDVWQVDWKDNSSEGLSVFITQNPSMIVGIQTIAK